MLLDDPQLGSQIIADLEAHAVTIEANQDRYTADFVNSATFDAEDYRQTWLIRNVLVEGQPAVVGGAKKALKTSTCLDMAISIAAGPITRFLQKFEVPNARRVGVISGESGAATIQETARRICDSKHLDLSQINVFWSFKLPQVSRSEDLDKLSQAIEENSLEVVILDPLYLSLLAGNAKANAASLFDMGPLLHQVSSTCLQAGATPILVHHTRKISRSDKTSRCPELEDLAFAGIQEFARQWILLGRREPFEPGEDHKLWLSFGGSAGHSGTWAVDINEGELDERFRGREWGVRVRSAAKQYQQEDEERQDRTAAKQEERASRNVEKMRIALTRFPEGETQNVLKESAGLNTASARPAINWLIDAGEVEETTITKNSGRTTRDYEAYRSVREEASDESE